MKRGRRSVKIIAAMRWIETHPTKTWRHAKRYVSRRSTFQLAKRLVNGFSGYARKNYYDSWKKSSAKARAAFLFYQESGFSQEVLKKVFVLFDGDKYRDRLIVLFNELDAEFGVLFTPEVDKQQTAWMEERRTVPGKRLY